MWRSQSLWQRFHNKQERKKRNKFGGSQTFEDPTNSPEFLSLLSNLHKENPFYWHPERHIYFISSVRSSSGYHGLIEIRSSSKATFSNFSNSSDSKVKVKIPNMCYIFEKHGIQGYRIWHSRVSNVKYTNTQLHKYANTQIQSA